MLEPKNNSPQKYSSLDYISDNPAILLLCFASSVGFAGYIVDDTLINGSDNTVLWYICGLLTGLWSLCFTIDYIKMKKLAKKGLL